ncbi:MULTISPECIES: MarR family winged helix-turn-helix transcriptional regulator [unclassified Streptomyces]|uniref:MarR family winged helix-turn-helix transcriptional regulator n=1 Tax=unclassified Streptomyces TaxID=2593676 RepID=UPI00161B1B4E|nr:MULTISPECIES: MarR family transcriptional regulator [unclassified Streptomyces]MBQ0863602.1 MarR family transcriptional regulator [Streptomyces sp. RK75]MBQ1125317.1 MarR family transcriptional regulator [Streptomyces sp. B15]
MHDEIRTANLLGAASLALSDRLLAGVTAAAGTSSSGAAALVVLSTDPGLSVTELGRRVGLSQSAAARMVDGLEKQGLIRRESTWGRWVAIHPTDAGTRAAHSLLTSRGEALTGALRHLDEDEQAQLDALLSKLLAGLYRQPGDAERLCRLCDRGVCVRDDATCPVGQADREHPHTGVDQDVG